MRRHGPKYFCFATRKNVWMQQLVSFTSEKLVGREWLGSGSGHLNPGQRVPFTIWVWYWIGTRGDIHDLGNRKYLPLAGNRTPAYRLSSLYTVRYVDSFRKPSVWQILSFWCRYIPDWSKVTSLKFALRHESFLLNDPSRHFRNAKLSLQSTKFVQNNSKARRFSCLVTLHDA
jgi:hypothetical protein